MGAACEEGRKRLDNDPDAHLLMVAASSVAARESSRLLRQSITGARSAGHSWETLGRLLGISRQAAQPRYMWEHRRLWWPSRRRQRLMEEQGWERIVPSDFDTPWAYYKRRLNEPAERA
ncbi:hypothetical protein ACFY05_01490 [Microtetraspora fusca]|uniref:Uncharacterized protein n=1 Tax=Microtetraspora fusca TaxID=1997 RepID=A0ABW6UWT5_MICFU